MRTAAASLIGYRRALLAGAGLVLLIALLTPLPALHLSDGLTDIVMPLGADGSYSYSYINSIYGAPVVERHARFDDRLIKFDPAKLSLRQSIDLRILQAAVKKELFEMQETSIFERNPMVYARAVDLNIYVQRNFAPLEDRIRSLTVIESQIPNVLIAARTNLNEVLPKPYVETAIEIAKGASDFLKKSLPPAVAGVKDEQVRVAFQNANRKAAHALFDYAV